MSEGIVKKLEALVESLEAGQTQEEPMGLMVIGLPEYDDLYLPSTLEQLSTSYKAILGGCSHCKTVPFKTVFLSVIVKDKSFIKGASELLIGEVEKLSMFGVLLGHLSKLSMLDLAPVDGDFPTAIFIFATVKADFDPSHYPEFDLRLFVDEGGLSQLTYDPAKFKQHEMFDGTEATHTRCMAQHRVGARCDLDYHAEGQHEAENAAEGGATLVWTEAI